MTLTPKEIVLQVIRAAAPDANPKDVLRTLKERGLDAKTVSDVLRVEFERLDAEEQK